ncbi:MULTISPECIES: SMP-30/gluconolactonase/LRE family protein [unclassified Rhodococcus (in: high G+C Gram-positive bacteria)]|uniref:SMP-30/gluconolactonase/LRE family protein n=1 Tax=unclassified Rhodococcus (in: high G+C Gram-positive bacteria) TaxID=192944 RepID=UPI001AEA62AD|nr:MULTISPECIES: SMP-30/gluconolactonase/LRE family protein [unclassified Rhodococcus (in: high G+C Gram-positive bacteria)]MBP1159421.1 sugar lactone lactonase YvrE [Rhodococcus sp. PvR099]
MQTVASGFGQLESPRWHDGRLWVADWTAGVIHAIDPDGRIEAVVEHRSLPLCFDFLPDGTPVLASGPERALLRLSRDRTLTRYADLSALSPYGSNDIVVDGRGNTYVNNVNFDFAAGPPAAESAPGFVALVTGDGRARVVAEDLDFPNGMAVTADNATLIVAESYRHRLTAFDIATDGSLSNRRVWAGVGDHSPDGICLDAEGAAWYADVGDRCCVRVAEGGQVLDRVQLDRGAFACALGGADGDTLFVVAAQWPGAERFMDHTAWDGTVVSTAAPAPGGGWPGA